MSSGDFNEAGFSVEEDDIGDMEAKSDSFGRLEERSSSIGETSQERVNYGQHLTRLEFNLACCSEKLANLNVLMMHLATVEIEFEASGKARSLADFAQGAVEFDLLSEILASEVMEMDNFMILIRNEINIIRKDINSRNLSEEISSEMLDKLLDCEKSLKQSQDHISEIRKQWMTFQTTSRFHDEDGIVDKDAKISIDNSLLNSNSTEIKMQTAEEQREILRMLEKTMGREMDLENKLAESKRIEEDLNQVLMNSVITDMENLIRDLELKVSKEESRANTAEERLLLLSKTNLQPNEDISILRGRLNCLEASLQEAEESKMATSKTIDFETKIIADLVKRLGVERERLHKQISMLTMENKLLASKLQHTSHQPSISKTDAEALDSTSKSGTARRIDAGVLNMKHGFLALLILMLSVGFYYFVRQDEQ